MLEKRLRHSDLRLAVRLCAHKNAVLPVKFPVSRELVWRRVRSALRRQPGSRALDAGLQPGPHRPRNPGFLRIRLYLQTPDLSISGTKLPIVSSSVREYSRFAEIISGDRFDHDCRPERLRGILADIVRSRDFTVH